jgi:RNA polymerase sigma factor (sigma-70 family)
MDPMNSPPLRSTLRHLLRLTAGREADGLSDSQLLERFVTRRDEAAFELLVWRHGRMVFNVCRRLLRREQDAEDAFQATFLVLLRRAGSIGKGEALAGWLYKVAARVALRARAGAAHRDARERPPTEPVAEDAMSDVVWRDLRPVLDEEVGRLPRKYRLPVVLCYLAGQTTEEAARRLGCPRGTVLSRLAWARQRLRTRLARRGLTLSTGALGAVLTAHASRAAPRARLIGGTLMAARCLAAGSAAVPGAASARAVALMEGVLRTMYLSRLRTVTAILVAGVLGLGVALWAYRPAEAGSAPAKKAEEAAPTSPAVAALPARATAVGLAGTWMREIGPYQVILRAEGDRLHGTFIAAPKDGNDENVTLQVDADYSVSKDGTLYGLVTGIDLSDEDAAGDAALLVDEPFSVRLRVDDDILVVKELKFRTGSNGGTDDLRLLVGRYKKMPASYKVPVEEARTGDRKPVRKGRHRQPAACAPSALVVPPAPSPPVLGNTLPSAAAPVYRGSVPDPQMP